MSFTHLHVHSHYSLRDGYQTIDEIVNRCLELNMKAIALTDHGTMSGCYEFYTKCKKAGIKPILGCEFYFTPDVSIKDRDLSYHLVLLAKNNVGYKNLLELTTLANQDKAFYYKPRIDLEMLYKHSEGLICLTACMGGVFSANNYEDIMDNLKIIFHNNGDMYCELQTNRTEEQYWFNQKVSYYSLKNNIPCVVTSDAHYAKPEDAKYHKVFADAGEYYSCDDFYLMSEEEVNDCMSDFHELESMNYPKLISEIIANKCSIDLSTEENNYPHYPTDNAKEELLFICRTNWKDKTQGVDKDQYSLYSERMAHEIEVLEKANYLEYMLILADVMRFCKEQDIIVGYGRGSASGSLVAYLLDITKVDPIKNKTLFERFVHLHRVSPADIDVDIPPSRRDEVIKYINTKYGYSYGARTFLLLQDKGAVKYACQRLKLDPQLANDLTKSMNEIADIPDKYAEIKDYAIHFQGRMSAFGKHACAEIIFDKDPSNFTAIERQGDNFLTAYKYQELEAQNLLKLDLLGLENLDIVKNTLDMIPYEIDIYDMSKDDPKVYSMISKGLTDFCFQIESGGMKQFCKDLKPKRFEDLSALVALYRPGPLDSGTAQEYIQRANGAEFEYDSPIHEEILSDTYGIFIYQEDMMKLVQRMANISLGEADVIRKAVGKKDNELLRSLMDEFIDKCVANGISEKLANTTAANIMACGNYLFNYNHACAYAHLTYLTAWLKCHYPLQYICSCLNSRINDTDKLSLYIKEAKRIGIKVNKPNILKSKEMFTVDGEEIQYGLSAIKGIGSINYSVRDCNNLNDFISINKLNKRILEALIKSGAIDCWGDRDYHMAMLPLFQEYHKLKAKYMDKIKEYSEKGNAKKVHEWSLKLNDLKIDSPEVKETNGKTQPLAYRGLSEPTSIPKYDKVKGEIEVLGYSNYDIPDVLDGKLTKLFTKDDSRGREMAFLTFKTDYGTIKSTVFSSMWGKMKGKLIVGDEYTFVNEKGILSELIKKGD